MSTQRVRDAGRPAMHDKPREELWPILVLVKLAQDKVDLVGDSKSDSKKAPAIGDGTTKSR